MSDDQSTQSEPEQILKRNESYWSSERQDTANETFDLDLEGDDLGVESTPSKKQKRRSYCDASPTRPRGMALGVTPLMDRVFRNTATRGNKKSLSWKETAFYLYCLRNSTDAIRAFDSEVAMGLGHAGFTKYVRCCNELSQQHKPNRFKLPSLFDEDTESSESDSQSP